MTTENNKLLQKFMNHYENIGNKGLQYHSDWNWLMQVVEKIESLDIYYNKYIDYNSSMFTSGKIELSTNIDHVYNACVSFIKWYNNQK